LTWEGWEQYQKEQNDIQYIKDLQYFDRNYPDLEPHPLLRKKRKRPKQMVARCYQCNTLSETLQDGIVIDFCPHCEAPFSERMVEREHWLYTHPEEAKEELRLKMETLRNLQEPLEKIEEGPVSADIRRKIIDEIKKDPSLIIEAFHELEQNSYKKKKNSR
jgi:uncharacterized CHY-type Zn-finger protein